ncbi:adenosylcobinamide-GDP ribazoletransferase [Variovorax arabinosiphilus]|uniref:adenosylcobinamide-GDP ribazoletransferase n=1 Tax=Variovorax arabinosiphilus TaxID=3053498 RepID=UPI00257784F4|nr:MULTISPECIES: adenosylcobinamide-GDP ribazoletransferase [unclassified Variovorax]MDM0119181.1 adenosylcobinamide-GDP ribazoletransferase [Variovorax sp. J2L1-78]MDM0129607.1 adenosylcobinamide-GDP ribazoletransferase [Variovorax sp. J2L1-63]MDM0232607.1 adenosylcobinamide-GDP ribazoletransferase [Variovorax sp. J2R1-6]
MNGVRHFLLALQFFTRIPVTGRLAQWVGYSPAMLRASAAHFPAVGWVVGAIGALALAGALSLWPPLVAAVLCTVVTVLVTGAFHEDGLADVADGLGGASTRERALEIMKDSRIGAFGAIAVVLALGLKVALLAALAGQGAFVACAALLAAHVLSRLAPLAVMRASPYVGGEGGKSKPMADAVSGTAVVVAVLWSLPAAALLVVAGGIVNGAAAVVAGALVALFMVRLLRRRLGGFTGDGLGATQQLSELAIYLALAARL